MTLPIEEIYNRQVAELERRTREFWTRSLAHWQQALGENPQSAEAYIEASRCLSKMGQHREALTLLEESFSRVPAENSYELYQWNIQLLQKCNCTNAAIASARQASELFPGEVSFKLLEALLLPIIYESSHEVDEWRDRFARRLQLLSLEVPLETLDEKRKALAAVRAYSNSRLGYQARNDRELQMQYGQILHRIMAANYPEWVKSLQMPEVSSGEKLRIGYVCSRFRNLSASKYFSGWLSEHEKGDFSVFAYYTGIKTDSVTEEIRKSVDTFRHIPNSLEETCRAILNDKLHILVFLDVGLESITTQLAALRLAPVQCAAWDQPTTTGLPTIDYFISSAAAEPDNAQEHYSEEVLLLPGIGVNYLKPVIPAILLTKTRRDFQLRDDAVVYLCIQYAYKYPPDQDYLLAQIAKEVPKAQFVFLTENDLVATDLQRRLERAFSATNLVARDYCVLLPAVERFTYWNLSLLGDVFLDAIGWSGGVSTFEAIACRLPVVTLPGEFMRGRQSYAILTELGVTDTIAKNAGEFVRIAVRLGVDREWRGNIVQRMVANYPSIYSDLRCVRALEDFYERTVEMGLRAQRDSLTSGGCR